VCFDQKDHEEDEGEEDEGEEDEGEEDEEEEYYGRRDYKVVRLCMAGGGSHAWDYVIMSGCVYIHRHPFQTMELEKGKMLICDAEATGNMVKLVAKDTEIPEGWFEVGSSDDMMA
jgi:hypothetical protein